ncbi:putative atp-dependent helicase [Hordeum vulgare]|nr:putative atp-dependent helicase [Hordeum vulgare]
MASSGSCRNDDPERARCVRSDAARKRAARRYTRWGLTPSPSLLRRETEEYDRARGRLFSGSSSFEASSSRSSSSLPPMKRELEELPSVKMEPEAEAVLERRVGAVVGPEDFLPPAEADSLLPVLLARSAREAEEDEQRPRREEEIDIVLYEQGVLSAIAFGHKVEEWLHEATAQKRIYVELSSDEDDEDDY